MELLFLPVAIIFQLTGGSIIWLSVVLYQATALSIPLCIIFSCLYALLTLYTVDDWLFYVFVDKQKHSQFSDFWNKRKNSTDVFCPMLFRFFAKIFYCSFAVCLRLISIIAAIAACFTDKFFVQIKKPRENNYRTSLHLFFDLVIPNT